VDQLRQCRSPFAFAAKRVLDQLCHPDRTAITQENPQALRWVKSGR
jgi:hypothetical protein